MMLSLFQITGPVLTIMPEAVDVNGVLLWSFKALFIALSVFFVIFSFVVIRQVKIMNDTVTTRLGPLLRVASIGLFILSVIIMLAAFTRL